MSDLVAKETVINAVRRRLDAQRRWGNREIAKELSALLEDVCLVPEASQALQSVVHERERQDAKWGQQNHEPQFWMGILMEEVGELAQAVNETVFDNGAAERAKGGYANMRAEAVQVAAVAVAFVEYLDRRYGSDSAAVIAEPEDSTDYKVRYEAVVQGLRDGYNELPVRGTASDLIAWMESTTPFKLEREEDIGDLLRKQEP